MQRKDAASKLFNKYKKIDVAKDVKKVTSKQIFDLSFMEIILSQDAILSQLNDTEMRELEKEIENKYLQKKAHPDIYSLTAASAYSVLAQKQDSSVSAQTIYYVYTPNGTAVEVFHNTPELTAAEKAALDDWVDTTYPTVVRITSATKNYNCHSYAWYSQSTTSNTWWMNYPNAYWTDGSYTRRTGDPAKNDKVYYSTSGKEHSGIIYELGRITGYYVRSKWGSCGLVEHYYTSCPYYVSDSALRYYYR